MIDPDLATMLADIELLVNVESPSHDVVALTTSAAVVAELIERRTGRPAAIVEGADGPHVHWRGGGQPRVLLLGHHDTVFPLGTLARRPFTVDGERATGPGVFDMKAGIVQAIHAVAALDDTFGVEMLFTADEEVGSRTSRQLIEERALACGRVLVLEPSADGGALKTGRKGTGTFELVVTGRAAHAGLDPDKGVNALIEAAHQVLRISAFGDPTRGTTVAPTVAHAGTADNVIPAEARVRIDVRITELDEARRVEQLMSSITPLTPGAQLRVSGAVDRPPMPESASTTLFPVARAVDPAIDGVAVGGASDGNFTAAVGVPTLDGLGAVGGGAHADHEHILVPTLPGRTRLIAGIVQRLV